MLVVFTVGDTFISFVRFISNNLLPSTPRLFILLPFGLLLVYLSFKKANTLFKFSLICGFLSVAVVVFFFLSTFKDFNFKNIFIYKLPSLNTLFSQSIFYFKSLVIPSIALGVFARHEKIKKGVLLGGLSLGLLCLAVTILNSVLLFGIKFSGQLSYPYSAAGSTVTFGNLFTRLDGFLYFVYSATCITKCAVGIFIIIVIVSRNRK
ncbi:MAG: GerAB/ArcD/ProY family transporter [Clostridia bacterium]|nr:GerAB/ArcD/ProY family transporter [Clostridia bacterium]